VGRLTVNYPVFWDVFSYVIIGRIVVWTGRRASAVLVLLFLVIACAERSTEPSSTTGAEPTTSTSEPLVTTTTVPPSTTGETEWPDWASSSVVEVDPVSLETVGPAIPAGLWSEGSTVTDNVVAFATWPTEETERTDPRWRLVVASRETGELLFDERVGDMNVLGMFTGPSGEVMVVEPIRSADWNHADGFVVRGYNPEAPVLREAARFDRGDLYPFSFTLLSDGLMGIVGAERSNDDLFDRYRIVVFDWETNETVMDVVLDDLPLEVDAPDGVFVDPMHHPVVWDEARSRVLVIHAHEDVITTVTIPTGDTERVPLVEDQSLLGAAFAWFVPAAEAKGLPSFQRQAVISGDHLYVVGAAVAFEKTETSHAYSHTATDLLKIDLDTLRIVKRAQPGATVVASSPNGGYLLGGGMTTAGHVSDQITTETEEYTGLLVIDPDTLEVIAHHTEVNISSQFEVQSAPTGEVIYIPGPGGRKILAFHPETGSINTTGKSGFEPALLKNALSYESP
jgi:hypothetical protein